ncbi:hypothetical protein ASE04_16145 [Rhizobium sp. Root708]|uniref:hypothetical protein n=1 Tax=Rhizobium sp. Root708 TaxID=1736592 RepID=UPI0006FDB3C5|nr:hypothetical protein [Rhizobium sp. Root708]KRB50430.1 hypothetical protein ASE04_16145 [Rhizobium sp. Root708]
MPDWTIRCGILFASLAAASSAHASSGDAWQEFATEVQGKCEIAARASIEFPHAIVDPFGSEHFGVALVTGKPKGANGFVSYFCIFDKRTKDVELGSELDTEQIRFLPEE